MFYVVVSGTRKRYTKTPGRVTVKSYSVPRGELCQLVYFFGFFEEVGMACAGGRVFVCTRARTLCEYVCVQGVYIDVYVCMILSYIIYTVYVGVRAHKLQYAHPM